MRGPADGVRALVFALLLTSCGTEPAPRAENLVLVTLDTLRADRLGAYGGDVATPHLDRIAREGAHARDAVAQAPLTRPSHLSLFTGRYPFEHGIRENASPPFEADLPLLAEILQEHGFRTAGFVSSIVLSSETGVARGFETYSDDFGNEDARDAFFLDSVQKRGDETTEEAVAWLRRQGADRFFLWLHLYDPHDPYEPPEPFASRYEGRPYDGEVAFTDELVGRLDEELRTLGLAERTLLVVTSDHGEAFGEHRETGHGYFVYEPTLRIPLLFRGPAVEPGIALSGPVQTVDVLPTVLEILGLPPPAEVSGRSLAAALAGGEEPPAAPLYAESLMAELLYGWGRLVSVREGPWKLIDAPKPELYHLAEDPGEQTNRIRRNPAAAERLRSRLAELAPHGVGATPAPSQLDPDLVAKLGALGYVGGSRASSGGASDVDPKDKIDEFRFLSGHMRAGLTHLQREEYAAAIARFREVLASGHDSFQALYHTGRAQYGLGRFEEAAAAFEGALALDATYGPCYLDLAEAYVSLARFEDAVEVLRRGQETLPGSVRLFEREGELWVSKGRPEEAARAFEAVAERIPGDPLTRVRLGEQYRDLGRVEESLLHLREAVRLAPGEASYWNSLGMVLGGSGRMEEAVEAFRKAHRGAPADPRYAFNLGLALDRLGRPSEARELFRIALENDPGFEPARTELRRVEPR